MPFNDVPTNLRVPFLAVEFDSSQAQAGAPLLAYTALLMGQMTSAGTATADVPVRVTSAAQVAELAGQGSMLHRMAIAWFLNNRFTETWILPVDDNGAGVAAAGDVDFTGSASADGTVSLYVGGEPVEVAVTSGDTPAAIATAVAAAINADDDLCCTAAVDGVDTTQVNITFIHKGLLGNEVDIRLNYQDGEELPAGVTAVVTAMSGGTTAPDLTAAIAAMGDVWFNILAFPWHDDTSLDDIEAELADRFGPTRMIDGVAFTSVSDTHGDLVTFGDGRNSKHISAPSIYSSPTPQFELAAGIAALAAYYGQQDPARPFQTLKIAGALAPADTDQFTLEERNLLLYDGIATLKATADGGLQIDRLITMYQTNEAAADDTAYLDVTTLLTLMYLRYSFRTVIATKYPRHKLADDGTRYGAGQAIITPAVGKAEAIAWFRDMEELGLVENFDQFKELLVVERDGSDVNRLNFYLPPNIINQFIVGAAQIQFRL